ncbi:hypothetical protein ACXR6G_17140 [Ancylomarina sp. YFZ004]
MKKLLISLIAASLLFISCEENNSSDNNNNIDGTYVGTLFLSDVSKSISTISPTEAFANVKIIGEQIEVHCYGGELDTTFMLDYYLHKDSVFVCHTGEEFETLYGHMKGDGHISGGMMGDMHNGESEWMHHLNDEHKEGDDHFGGFDMEHQSFSYLFTMEGGDIIFQGAK